MNLQITLQDTNDSLQELKPNWNELLEDSHANTVFLTREWINTWWQIFGDRHKLYILCARDSNDQLLGIAPLKVSRRKYLLSSKILTLEFIGYGEDVTPEYLNFIIKKGYEKEVTQAMFEFLFQNSECEVYDLRSIPSDYFSISSINKLFDGKGLNYSVETDSICPVAELPNNSSDFFNSKSRNFKKKMGEYNRRIERDLNVKLTKCTSLDELDQCYNQLIQLHHNRWNGSSESFKSKKYIEFHRLISKIFFSKDWLRLFFLRDGNKPIAGIYCYFYNGQYYYYQSGRDLKYSDYRVGTVILNKVIEEAINEGATHFDFLTGTESYKFRWANRVNKNIKLCYWKNQNRYLSSKLYSTAKKIVRIPFNIIRYKP